MQDVTRHAIEAFKDARVSEDAAERANQRLNRLVAQVPNADMAEYMRQTNGFAAA